MANRGQLRNSARIAADQDNSEFPTDEAYNDIIDRAASSVWRRLLAAGWTPDRTIVSITATGASQYTIGTDVHTVNSVQRIDGTNVRVPLRRLKPEELADYQNFAGAPASAYDLIGGALIALSLELFPNPSTGNYEVRYTKRFPGFVSDADMWYGPDGSDDLIIYTAALEGVDKENGDTSGLTRKLQRAWDDVIEAAQWQDAQGQQTVRDVHNQNSAQAGINAFNYLGTEGWY